MRSEIELLREFAEIADAAKNVGSPESQLRWLMRLGVLAGEVQDYLAAVDSKRRENMS